MSSVCADSNECLRAQVKLARMSLLLLTAAAHGGVFRHPIGSWVIGQQLTVKSELARTPGIRLSN